MRYCSGFETMVPDSPYIPYGFTHTATVRPCPARTADPSHAHRKLPDTASLQPWFTTADWNVPAPAFHIASRFMTLSWKLPSNFHQPLRFPGTGGGVTHAPLPTRYSTVFVVVLPAASVAATVNVCWPGVVSRGEDPSIAVQLATPE